MNKKVTSDWTIAKLLEKYPKAADILVEYGFHCIGCALAQFETIEQGTKVHGLGSKELKKLMEELDKLTKSTSRKKPK